MSDLTSGKPFGHILRLGIPLFLGSMLQQSYVLINSLLVGQFLGSSELAAIGIAGPLVYLVVSIVIGLAVGFAIHIAYRKGAGDDEGVRSAIRAMVWLFAALGLVAVAVAAGASAPILAGMGVPAELLGLVHQYTVVVFCGIIFQFLLIGLSAALRALGDSVTPLYSLLFASLLNVGLDLLFIGPLQMGLFGVAIGTVITQGLNFLILFVYLVRKNPQFSQIFRWEPSDLAAVRVACKLGVFPALQHILLSSGILLLVWIITPYGTAVIAAATVVGRIEMFVVMFFAETGSALTTYVAQNSGGGNQAGIRTGLRHTMAFCSVVALAVSLLLCLFPIYPVSLFCSETPVIELAARYLQIAFPFFVCLALTNVLHGYLNGVGKTYVALVCTFLAFVVARVPLSWLMGRSFGTDGLWWAVAIGWAVGLAYTLAVLAWPRRAQPAELDEPALGQER